MSKVKIYLNEKRTTYFILLICIFGLAFLSLWKAVDFHFWRDDWADLWAIIYHPETSIYFNYGNAFNLHPGSALEKVIFAKVFGFNHIQWQILGIILRILDSCAIALMVFGLTKSRRVGYLAGLFSASAVGGLESVTWISAHISAIFILFVSIGIYFWSASLINNAKKIRYFLLAMIFISIALISTPARGALVVPLLALWDVMYWYRIKGKELLYKILSRNIFLIFIVFILVKLLNFSKSGLISYGNLTNLINPLLKNPDLIENYLYSVGNLLISWFYFIKEPISLGNPSNISLLAALTFLIIILVSVIVFLLKKSLKIQMIVLFSFWLLLFYFPNFLYEKTLIVGSSHRYLAISAISIPIIVAIFLNNIKKKKLIIFSTLFIGLNIISSNKVLYELAQYRSYKVVQPIWDKINNDVPKDMKNMIFMYYGGDLVWGTSMTWSASVPFGIMRGYTDAYDFPIVTGDRDLIVNLLCKDNIHRPSVSIWTNQIERIPISHLFAWTWKDGTLTDISEIERKAFIKEANCKVEM